MRIAGIIAEYNPFHNGHKHQIDLVRTHLQPDIIVAIMSGNFVQRGEPAIFDKWTRATAALNNGIDIVIELPVYNVLQSAEGFARGAVHIAKQCGVTHLCFGSECGDLDMLTSLSNILSQESETFKASLKKQLSMGESFAKARALAVAMEYPDLALLLEHPNNVLAVEYLAEIGNIVPFTHKRAGVGHNDRETSGMFASASAIRDMINNGEDISRYVPLEYQLKAVNLSDFGSLICYRLLFGIDRVTDTGDGLLERISACKALNFEELLTAVKTKRFTMARIKRVLLNLLISNDLESGLKPQYIRPLAMNEKGVKMLKQVKLPIIDRCAKFSDAMWDLEQRATDIYNLACNGKRSEDLTRQIIKNGNC